MLFKVILVALVSSNLSNRTKRALKEKKNSMVVKQLGFFIDDNVKCRPFRTQKFMAFIYRTFRENTGRYGVKTSTIKPALLCKINVSPTLQHFKFNGLFSHCG